MTEISTSEGGFDTSKHQGLAYHDVWSIPCGELIKKQKVIIIDSEATIESACQTLVINGISSAPVYNKTKKTFIGMLDYRDVVTYLLLALNKKIQMDETVEVQELIRKARNAEPVPASLASDISQKNPFYSIQANTPLSQIIDIFGQGVHRVVVIDDHGVYGILSQSTIIAYLLKASEKDQDLAKKLNSKIGALGLGNKHVIAVHEDVRVVDGLELMAKNNISSLAVVQRSGALIGNISMTDIKWVMKNNRFGLLHETAIRFVSFVDQQQGLIDGKDRYPVFDITEESNLKQGMGKLVATKAHRLWVVEKGSSHRPISVLSLTDILRVLTPLS